tara:strand:- start:2212 stop:2937 length:726 start_codon:yes stop_codon:yes gene_type:complete
MREYFKILIEFDHHKLEDLIQKKAFNGKGYCCFVDLNSLVYSWKNPYFRKILNSAVINSCDGSYIATAASKIHGRKLKQYIGPDFFNKFILNDGTHIILGSTPEVYQKIMNKTNSENSKLYYIDLPFKGVDEFDYYQISERINNLKANYIWVSLGAPKQEIFMNKILPFLNGGMMIGVGAALNYFSGEIRDIPVWSKKLKIVWVYRLITEPKKQFKRLKSIFSNFPQIIREEIIHVRNFNK